MDASDTVVERFLFSTLIEDLGGKGVSRERLPTNTTTNRHPIHRWFNFIAGFSPEFVSKCIERIAKENRRLLLDPFAGCATSLVVAKQFGMDSIGYEPHPFFAQIARAKTLASYKDLENIGQVIRFGFDRPVEVDTLPDSASTFLRKLFPETSLKKLLGARKEIERNKLASNPIAFLVLSKVLEFCTHSQTDGIYKAPTTKKGARDPESALRATIELITADTFGALDFGSDNQSRIIDKSSELISECADDSVSIIVTSPPYLNNFDFAEMTRMYLYFWGIANSWSEITQRVRSKLVVNTTTALKGHKDVQDAYRNEVPKSLHSELENLVSELADARVVKAGKKEYDYLIYPYFAQMRRILRECNRCLQPNAPIHIMVADAALYGVHIPAPQLLAAIMDDIGFNDVRCEFVRRRGHRWVLDKREGSKRGLGEYHLSALA